MNPHNLCPECGSDRRSGSFCDVCGAVLHWTAPPAAATPQAQPPDKDDDDTAIIDEDGTGAGPGTETVKAEGSEPSADHATERARLLLVPVDEGKEREPVESEVEPVLPGRPQQARPMVRAAEPETIIGGGVLCPWCGTANPHERHFCRQCAMSLATPEDRETRTRSWWRRLFDRDGREAPWAGERPRLRRGVSRVVFMVMAAAAVIGLVVAVAVYTEPAVNAVRDHFAKRVPTTPDGSRASHSDPRNGPAKAFDGLSDTYWGDGYGGSGFGQFVETTFSQPQRLLNVIITPGISKRPDLYATQGRPQLLDATLFSSDGGSTTQSLRLDDLAGPQKFRLRGANVVRVRLTIRSAFGATASRQVAIAEVEFFARTARKLD